jgi:hypothetical protein
MSSVGNAYEDQSKITYLATRTFENDLFSYTTAINSTTFERTGTLTAPISGATSGTCPVGRFLYETGKKLIPGAHPGVKTLMVGVFDPVSFLSGYIDPNSEVFTRMNEDKSAMLDTITTSGTLDFGVFGRNPNGNTSDLADPVYTRGDVTALGQATITGDITSETGDITATAGDITATAGNIVAAKQIRSGYDTVPGTLDFVTGNIDKLIDISTYPSQNIAITASASGGAIAACTINFSSNGTAGDLIRLIIRNTSTALNTITFDSSGNVKNSNVVLAGGNTGVLTYVSNGTLWFLTSAVVGIPN